MAKRFIIETLFKAADLLTGPIRRMQTKVGAAARTMERNFRTMGRRVDRVNRGLKTFGRNAVLAIGAMTAALTKTTLVGADFEQTLVDAAVKFPGMIRKGTAEFEALEKSALDVAATSRFMARDTAGSLLFMAKAGFEANEAIRLLPQAVDFATANNFDLARSTDMATDALSAFGLESDTVEQRVKSFGRVTNVMTLAANRSNMDLEQMFDTIKDAAPLMKEANISLEDAAATIAVLANSGIKGSKAGTALKATILGMVAPTSEAGRVMDKLLKVSVAADGEFRRFTEVFKDMNAAIKELPKPDRLKVIDAIFGKRAIAGSIKLINDKGKGIAKLSKEMVENTDVVQKWAKVQRDTTKGSIERMKSSIESMGISVFKATQGPITEAVEATTKWFNANKKLIGQKVGDWVKWIATNIGTIISMAKGLAILLGVWLAITSALKGLVLVMTLVNIVVALNPFVILGLAIVALVAGIVFLIMNLDAVRKWFVNAPTWVRVLAGVLTFGILPVILLIREAWVDMANVIKTAFDKLASVVAPIIDTLQKAADLTKEVLGITDSKSPTRTVGGLSGALQAATPGVSPLGGPGGFRATTESIERGESFEQRRERFFAGMAGQSTETRTVNELVIKDETGRAQATGDLPQGVTIEKTGGF